jgi:hypothetical protein
MRPLVVLGSPRSGTSLTARLLVAWGAYGGEPDEQQVPDAINPRGYHEWMPLAHFHNALFDSIPVTPAHAEFESWLVARAADPRWRAEVDGLVARIAHGSRCWFWKYPQYAWALPFWTRVLPDVRYIVCLRDPRAICESMAGMYVPPEIAGQIALPTVLLLLWQHHMTAILRAIAGADEVLFLSFEALLLDAVTECGRLARFLGTPPAPRPLESIVVEMVSAIELNLWRSRGDAAVALTERQQRLWQTLEQARVDGLRDRDLDACALEPLEREVVNLLLLLNGYHYRLQQHARESVRT